MEAGGFGGFGFLTAANLARRRILMCLDVYLYGYFIGFFLNFRLLFGNVPEFSDAIILSPFLEKYRGGRLLFR